MWLCLFLLPFLTGCAAEKKGTVSEPKESAVSTEETETVSIAEEKMAVSAIKERSMPETEDKAAEEVDSASMMEAEIRTKQASAERRQEEYIRPTYFNGNRNWVAPIFLQDSDAVTAANREIRAKLQELTKDSAQAEKLRITYQSWLKEDILSVLIQADNGLETETHYFSYNFEVTTGRRLTMDELLQSVGIDWQEAEQLFAGERKAYWRAIAIQEGVAQDKYLPYAEQEIKTLQTLYAEGRLALILDEDKLLNLLVFLQDGYGESYWRLYCLTANRTILLQRNSYGGGFLAAVLVNPSAEELANVKIVKRILEATGDQKQTYLLLPLWDGLSFEWSRKNTLSVESSAEVEQLWTSGELLGEDTIYVELNADETRYCGVFHQYDEESIFHPDDFQTLSQEERGILYLPVR